MGDQLVAVLGRLRREKPGEAEPPPDALLFPGKVGAPLDADALRKRVWLPALATAGLSHVRIHSLRHSFASMLVHQGENPKYVSSQLGHASIQITLDRYAHLYPDEKRTAATRFEAQLAAAAVSSSSHPADPAGTAETSPKTVEDGTAVTARKD
jgi:integrase